MARPSSAAATRSSTRSSAPRLTPPSAIVRRVIHATADFSFARTLRIHPQAVAAGMEALTARRAIVCDVNMLAAGITRAGTEVLCTISDDRTMELARRRGCTRAAAAMELLGDRLAGSIVAIGNAPTALWKLMEMAAAGGPRPALVVGLPVGLVGARESKTALLDSGLCYITNTSARRKSRRGGGGQRAGPACAGANMTGGRRTGITTGACAAAAAKAAAMVLCGQAAPAEVEIPLPGGGSLRVPVLRALPLADGKAAAAVRKDAGDDPDVTHGMEVVVTLWQSEGSQTEFLAGEGVGTVTKPGLQVPPGQPAINPAPRRMVAAAIGDVTPAPMCVEIAIPGGADVAVKTYNPRLGIVGGLSVLGTTGIVRPYCKKALLEALGCELDVAAACGVRALVLTPGNIGTRAARRRFKLADEQVVEVGNEWGFVVKTLAKYAFEAVLVAGHPGKLAKLAAGEWDTHSSRSAAAVEFVRSLAAAVLAAPATEASTTEGLFESLDAAPRARRERTGAAGSKSGGGCDRGTTARCGHAGEHGRRGTRQGRRPFAMGVSERDIRIVGCGPGSAQYVSPAAHEALRGADVLLGSARLLELFPEFGGAKVAWREGTAAMLDELERWLLQSKTAVVLVSGDPGIFSLAEHVVKRFGAARCQIVPAVSSVQVAFARLGLSWVDAKIVSAHGRDAGVAVAELSRHDRVAILAGTADGLDFCADAAEAARASHNAFLCENLTLPDERVRRLLPEEIRQSGASSLSIVLLVRKELVE